MLRIPAIPLMLRLGLVALCLHVGVGGRTVSSAETLPVRAVEAQQLAALDVATVLRRMGQTYAGMAGYHDRGLSVVRYSVSPRLNSAHRFTTHFERTRYFSWASDLGTSDDYQISSDGVRIVERWYGRSQELSNLGDAIAGATGVSHLGALWVPTLLMPEILPGSGLLPIFRQASTATRQADEDVGRQHCFVLQAQNDRVAVRVWISTQDFLIRRIEHRNAGSDAVTTTDYTPQTDISLTP